MEIYEKICSAYRGKRVLVTGHTGFKGSWLCRILHLAGAKVFGYSLPADEMSMFRLCGNESILLHSEGDVCNFSQLKEVFDSVKPQFVFHLAAQALVSEGYKFPAQTYETNVMGTVNLLECVRLCGGTESVLVVTTDKVYAESKKMLTETDRLDGFDPYSNSKSCAELAAGCYRRSFPGFPALSTVRAGNTIGGGDFAANRILPDCARAAAAGRAVVLRHPLSVRPYQHVLDVLSAYLLLAAEQVQRPVLSSSYNVAPARGTSTERLAELYSRYRGGPEIRKEEDGNAPHETLKLRLRAKKLRELFPDLPHTPLSVAVKKTAEWEKARLAGQRMDEFTDAQIRSFFAGEWRV